MNKKITMIFVIAIISLCCIGIVSAYSNSTENATSNDNTDDVDLSQYITATSIAGDKVEFSDSYTGFKLDSNKNDVTSEDGFTPSPTSENDLKLIVIEAYKANKEDELGTIMASYLSGDYDSNDPVISAALSSDEEIGDQAVVMIDNTTEATFDFEVLEPIDDATSDYFAYKVSMKTVDNKKLSATPGADDSSQGSDDNGDSGSDDNTDQGSDDKNGQNGQSAQSDDNKNSDGQTNSDDSNKAKNDTKDNKTDDDVTPAPKKEKTNPPPKPKEPAETVMEVAGNPIAILLAVIVLGGAIAIVLHRKD